MRVLPIVVAVVAVLACGGDKKKPTLDTDVTHLLVEPAVVAVRSIDKGVQLSVAGFFAGSGSQRLSEGLLYEVADPALALVDGAGVVRAASADANGTTTITVRYGALVGTTTAVVSLDSEPPGRPSITGWFAETGARYQTWQGQTEPRARVVVAGSASDAPIETKADPGGRFWVNVPLAGNRAHDVTVTLSDELGNTSPAYAFPVRQSDGFTDAGTLHLSSDRKVIGFVGELVVEPLVARAYGPGGAALPGAAVTFTVARGDGALAAGDGDAEARTVTVGTDGAGYASVRWRLGPSDYGLAEVHATLAGDTGFPTVFSGEGFARIGEATRVHGVCYDEHRIPIAGLSVTLLEPGTEYASDTRGASATTDERGRFALDVPETGVDVAHERHLRLDGTGLPEGGRYVRIDDLVTILPGQDNDAGTFWIPRLPEGVAPTVDSNGVVTEAIVLERVVTPGEGVVRVRVPVGTKITWPGGVPESARKLALIAIPERRTPMTLPDGFFSQETIALQPGGTRFEPPLPLDLPNSALEPPGAALTLWSYDHFQSEFVPIGRGIVSADGTRVVSEAGSGIRVGAWHRASPIAAAATCTVMGQVREPGSSDPEAKKKKKPTKCKCYVEGTDQPTDCPEDADGDGVPDPFVIPNVSGCDSRAADAASGAAGAANNAPRPRPPGKKVEVVCEEEPLRITSPLEKELTVPTGTTITFVAECFDGGKSNDQIRWRRSAPEPKSGTGQRFTLKFENEGRFTVSAVSETKTCKGKDQRVVIVKSCVDVGVVRVCGDTFEPFGPPSDGRYLVKGNVRMGMKGPPPGSEAPSSDPGDLFLHSSSDVIADATSARAAGPSILSMDVGWGIFGIKRTPVMATVQPWTLDGASYTIKPPPKADEESKPIVKLVNFPLAFEEMTLGAGKLTIKTPKLGLFSQGEFEYRTFGCPLKATEEGGETVYKSPPCSEEREVATDRKKASELDISITGIELSRYRVIPNGVFEYNPHTAATDTSGIWIAYPYFGLTRIKLGYENARFIGELGIQSKLGGFGIEILGAAVWGEGLTSVRLEASFGRRVIGLIEVPGVPIVPTSPVGPVYLTKVGVGYESTNWPVSDDEAVTFKGLAGFALGPTVRLGHQRYSLAAGQVDFSLTPYPLAFSATGTYQVFREVGVSDIILEDKALSTITAKVDVTLEPTFGVSIGGGIEIRLPDLAAPGMDREEQGDAFAKGDIKGTIKVDEKDPRHTISRLEGTISWMVPATHFSPAFRFLNASYKIIQAGRISPLPFVQASAEFPCILVSTCHAEIADDPLNGLSVWVWDDRGDLFTLIGKDPSFRKDFLASAPGIGLDAETPFVAEVVGPVGFELLEAAPLMQVTVEKQAGTAGTLVLPSGRRVGPIEDPTASQIRSGVDHRAALDDLSATWFVYAAEPGLYTFDPDGTAVVSRIAAYVAPPAITLAFEEPFVAGDEEALEVAWTGAGPSDATVTLLAVDVLDERTTYEIGVGSLDGDQRVAIDDTDVPRGHYRIAAEVRTASRGRLFLAAGHHVLGVDAGISTDAPRLVRASYGDDDTLEVSWLPALEPAEAYAVSFTGDDGVVLGSASASAPANRARVQVSSGPARGIVRVSASDGSEVATCSVELPSTLVPTLPPPRFAKVGAPWSYGACRAPRVLDGPPGLVVAGDSLTWTPTASELGTHDITVEGCERASFQVFVGDAETAIPPEDLRPRAARHVAGVAGEALTFSCGLVAHDALSYIIVNPPAGASVDAAGVVSWTPDVATAIALGGAVPITCRGTAGGLASDATTIVHLADRDGDGLRDDFEVASGLDPDVANDPAADRDGDGLSDRDEDELGTRGDADDSDGDGVGDGGEVGSPRLADSDGDGIGDGDEAAGGTDPNQEDSDGDGLSDATEELAGSDPNSAADADGDGLADDVEADLGTDPSRADSDGDGLSDAEEVRGYHDGPTRCSEPTEPRVPDTDGDGVDDATEARACDGLRRAVDPGTDRDGDGLRSDRERAVGTSDLHADSDGDGLDDGLELAMETDPSDAASVPADLEVVATEPLTTTGESGELVVAPESLTDFGEIFVIVDADRDSAGDDYETQWQYDPGSAADAYDDADGDLVPMWQESRLGTNPRERDSDGDGVDDGQEVQDGTDPTDPESVSATGPATSLTLYPKKAALRRHAYLGSVTLPLTALGARADGSTVDLTATARGTSYAVDPIEAGTVDAAGAFVASQGFVGTVRIDAANLALSASCTIEVESFVPTEVGRLALGSPPTSVALAGDTALVGGAWGVRLVDVGTPETPVAQGDIALAAAPGELAAEPNGSWVAAAMGAAGFSVIALGDSPRVIATVPGFTANGIAWAGGRVLVASADGLLRVDPHAGLGFADGDGDGDDDRIVDVQGAGNAFTAVAADLDRVVAARADGQLVSYRLVSGGLIQEHALTPGVAATRLVLRGGLVYGATAATAAWLTAGPAATWTASAPLGVVWHVAPVESFLLATESQSGTVVFLDARGATPLSTLGSLDFDAFFPAGLAVDRRFFYLADGFTSALIIGAHNAPNDTLGVPPRVVPVSPLVGVSVPEGTTIPVTVAASDDIGVRAVTITRDDADVATFEEAPYTIDLATTNVSAPTAMRIGARASDFGDNLGEMAPIVFEVTPIEDTTPPTVAFESPSDGSAIGNGASFVAAITPSDETAIWKVELHMNGTLVATIDNAPWVADLVMPTAAPNDEVVLTATAYDYGEGQASATATLALGGFDLVRLGETVIGEDDTRYEGASIYIAEGTIQIDGAHTFKRVTVGPGGVLTHRQATVEDADVGLELEVERFEVMAAGRIDVVGRGYLGDCQPLGTPCSGISLGVGNSRTTGAGGNSAGTHGGLGGGLYTNALYGDPLAPTELGTGGGLGSSLGAPAPGSDGGGRVHVVADIAVIDGEIRADGDPVPGGNGAAGAGGSVFLEAGQIRGLGLVSADGGFGPHPGNGVSPSGQGGGGRVALVGDEVTFPIGNARAWSGGGPAGHGGAGTVFVRSGAVATLLIDAGDRPTRESPFIANPAGAPYTLDADLVVRGGARLVLESPLVARDVTIGASSVITHPETDASAEHGLDLTATDLTIATGGAIDVSGRGFEGDCRPGDPACANGAFGPGNADGAGGGHGTGGSHGGVGGGLAPKPTYGDPAAPVTSGAGGGHGNSQGGIAPGGDGGGRVRLDVARLLLAGEIRADGAEPGGNGSGGAGGSVWIRASADVGGDGIVSAKGGVGPNPGNFAVTTSGQGGGGRIAIAAQDIALEPGQIQAAAGSGPAARGGAGTVFLTEGGGTPTLVIDGDGLGGEAVLGTPGVPFVLAGDLIVRGQRVALASKLVAEQVLIEDGCVLTHVATSTTAEGDLEIEAELISLGAGASIDVTGRGYLGDCFTNDPACGDGAYTRGNTPGGAGRNSGGSHGGRGAGAASVVAYGDFTDPRTLGGGGGASPQSGAGAAGGGRVSLAAKTCVIDGQILARGADALHFNGGAGAGGSVLVRCDRLGGAGTIDASGGIGQPQGGIAGGGGRVAVIYDDDVAGAPFDLDGIDMHGAADGGVAGAGTLWIARAGEPGRLVIDNAGAASGAESAPWAEVGPRLVTSASGDRVVIAGAGFEPDALIGLGVTIGTSPTRRTIASNTADTLVFTSGGVGAVTGQPLVAWRTLELVLEIRNGARVALGDRLVVTGDLVLDGAVLTHAATPFGGAEPGLWIEVEGAFTIAADATIDVTGRGYRGDCAGGDPTCGDGGYWNGNVPGGATGGGGGSHGGLGGGPSNATYGSADEPWSLGAGGGVVQPSPEGGGGGGRIRLIATLLALEGQLLADALIGSGSGGGGAGGSIWVTAITRTGSGRLFARGGGGGAYNGADGGGGGRVRVEGGGPDPEADVGGGPPGFMGSGGEAGTVVFD